MLQCRKRVRWTPGSSYKNPAVLNGDSISEPILMQEAAVRGLEGACPSAADGLLFSSSSSFPLRSKKSPGYRKGPRNRSTLWHSAGGTYKEDHLWQCWRTRLSQTFSMGYNTLLKTLGRDFLKQVKGWEKRGTCWVVRGLFFLCFFILQTCTHQRREEWKNTEHADPLLNPWGDEETACLDIIGLIRRGNSNPLIIITTTPASISPFATDCKTPGKDCQSSPCLTASWWLWCSKPYLTQTPAIDRQVEKTKGRQFAGKMLSFSALGAHFWHPTATRLHNILKIMLTTSVCLLPSLLWPGPSTAVMLLPAVFLCI